MTIRTALVLGIVLVFSAAAWGAGGVVTDPAGVPA